MEQSLVPEQGVFLYKEALDLTAARQQHLATLGLDLNKKKVLEVGGGIGLHSGFFLKRDCDLLFTEPRPFNLMEALRRNRRLKTALLDLDQETDLKWLGQFDVVYCYGVLYHLQFPEKAIRQLSEICNGVLLLDTMVSPAEGDGINVFYEDASVLNQAVRGVGCRPSRRWVLDTVRKYWGHGYISKAQPNNIDFLTNWKDPNDLESFHARSIFVGSKTSLDHLGTLSSELLEQQERIV